MVPLSAVTTLNWTYGSPSLQRYNGSPSVEIVGSPAPGRSSGEAMTAIEELAAKLPAGIGYEWTGQSYEERLSGSQAPMLYALSLIVVFLCLAALYESWSIPTAVLLVVPLGIVGALAATWLRGLENDVYFKVGFLTIIGLSTKNAILIVEFAKEAQERGLGLIEATLEAVHLRLRPILMTSLAFILGVTPLALAAGAGSASQHAIGTGVIGGMITATVLAIFLVPVFYVVVRRIFKTRRSAGTHSNRRRAKCLKVCMEELNTRINEMKLKIQFAPENMGEPVAIRARTSKSALSGVTEARARPILRVASICRSATLLVEKPAPQFVPAARIVLLICAAAFVTFVSGCRPPGSGTAGYETATASRGDFVEHVTASGTLSAVVSVDVGSQVSGKISALYVDFNSPVKKGQLVAEIDPTVYEAALRQAEGELASAKANVTLKRQNLERKKTLVPLKAASQLDLDQATAELAQAEATVSIRQAAVDSAKANLGYCKITAPVDGIVISRKVDVGQTVNAAMSTPVLFTIAQDITKMNIKRRRFRGGHRPGQEWQPVDFTVDAFPDEVFHGTVTQVRKIADHHAERRHLRNHHLRGQSRSRNCFPA